MPRRPDQTSAPHAYVAPGGVWPVGPFEPVAPLLVLYAAAITANLAAKLEAEHLTVVAAAQMIGVSRRTLHAVLSGQVVPDLRTIVLAEASLGVRLWPTAPPYGA